MRLPAAPGLVVVLITTTRRAESNKFPGNRWTTRDQGLEVVSLPCIFNPLALKVARKAATCLLKSLGQSKCNLSMLSMRLNLRRLQSYTKSTSSQLTNLTTPTRGVISLSLAISLSIHFLTWTPQYHSISWLVSTSRLWPLFPRSRKT